MNKFKELMVTLHQEGYDFSIFIRKDDGHTGCDSTKFSAAYVTSVAERLLPFNVWESVDDGSIINYDRKLTENKNDYSTFKLSLDKPQLVEKYVEAALKLLRQVPCKVIAKAWIKIIEPKKKTKYPYIKGESTKPSWWPDEVEHKEPDHLRKPDRLKLLCVIITEVLPHIGDLTLLEDVKESTLALPLFKQEASKRALLFNLFAICKNLFPDYSGRLQTIEVMNLGLLKSKQELSAGSTCSEAARADFFHPPIASGAHEVSKSGRDISQEFGPTSSELSSHALIDLLVENDPDLHDYLTHLETEGSA